MELTHPEITQVLGLYEKYCKILHIEQLPVLTLNIEEYNLALQGMDATKQSEKYLSKLFGQCSRRKDKTFNDIIYLNSKKFIALLGLHEHEKEPHRVTKRKYTYMVRNQLGHLEETLIHELIHVRYPRQRHGEYFKRMIKYYYNKGNKY